MPSQRTIGWIAVATPVWFVVVYLTMASLRPEYSHLTKAISELGSWDAPNRWWWNLCGYIAPGLAVSLLGVGLWRTFKSEARIWSSALVVSGLFMALSGVFPGDFEHRQSASMMMHLIGSLGSYVAFLVAGFGLIRAMRSSAGWRWVAWPSLALVLLSIASGFLRSGSAPGLGQRLGFACFFLWIAIVGVALLRSSAAELQTPAALRAEA